MRAAADRSRRLVFDRVADAYVAARPDLPLEAVLEVAGVLGLSAGCRVLEVGAGGGQLTAPLAAAGFAVVALEPGKALRARAAARVPAADLRAELFEDFEPDGRFDAVFSANAFHWVDRRVAHAKAAAVADAIVLLWNTPYPRDPDLLRRVQRDVLGPRGSTFPETAAGVRALVAEESAAGRDELRASGLFDEPWWRIYERPLRYSPQRYADLIGSMSGVAVLPDRAELVAELRDILGGDTVELVDLVYVVAARAGAR
jgi:SAM-dependent methyltransferase